MLSKQAKPTNSHPSDSHLAIWLLEALAFESHAIPSEMVQQCSQHLNQCNQCKQAIDKLKTMRHEFLQARPSHEFIKSIHRHLNQPIKPQIGVGRKIDLRFSVAMGVLSILALVIFFFILKTQLPDSTIRYKGAGIDLSLALYVSRNGRPAVMHADDQPLHPDDIIRFAVKLPNEGYVFIASLDDSGVFARFYPQPGNQSAFLPYREDQTILPGAIKLDAFIGNELIALIFSNHPIDEKTIRHALNLAYRQSKGRLQDIMSLDLNARIVLAVIQKVPI